MFLYDVNWLAVLVAGIVSMILGMLWYSPVMFGKPWAKLMGYDMSDQEAMAKMKKEARPAYLAGFITTLVMVFVFAVLVSSMGIAAIGDGILLAFLIWLGFVATVQLGSVLWGGKSLMLWKIDAGYQLANLIIMSLILVSWV